MQDDLEWKEKKRELDVGTVLAIYSKQKSTRLNTTLRLHYELFSSPMNYSWIFVLSISVHAYSIVTETRATVSVAYPSRLQSR